MTKLSDAQIKVLDSVHTNNVLPKGTRQATVDILDTKENLIYSDQGVWRLTESGSIALGVPHKRSPNEITEVEQEQTESDDEPVPYFNRKARRESRRNRARANRRAMYNQGKSIKRYGAHDPKYFRRAHLRMLAQTSDSAYDAA